MLRVLEPLAVRLDWKSAEALACACRQTRSHLAHVLKNFRYVLPYEGHIHHSLWTCHVSAHVYQSVLVFSFNFDALEEGYRRRYKCTYPLDGIDPVVEKVYHGLRAHFPEDRSPFKVPSNPYGTGLLVKDSVWIRSFKKKRGVLPMRMEAAEFALVRPSEKSVFTVDDGFPQTRKPPSPDADTRAKMIAETLQKLLKAVTG